MRKALRQPGRAEITVPHNYVPRSYQVPFWERMQAGCTRAIKIHHRKAGKDIDTLNWLIRCMLKRDGTYWYLFPDGVEARRTIWDAFTNEGRPFLDFFPKELIREKNETEMLVRLATQTGESVFQLIGTDDADRLRGPNPVGVVFSEYPYHTEQAWEIVAPVLAANGGWAVFAYTPCGRNHGFRLYEQARRDPSWFVETLTIEQTKKDAPGEDGGPVITPEMLAAERRRGVDEDFIQQEYFCSFEGTRSGSIFGDTLRRIRERGQIGSVPWNPAYPVETWVDLGIGKNLAVWFAQFVGARVHLIDFFEGAAADSVMDLAKVLQAKPYTYQGHLWPHDASTKDIGTGRSRVDIAEQLGVRPIEVVAKGSKADGITQAKALLERCYFDEGTCRRGLDCLLAFHRAWDTKLATWKDEPVADWSAHAADAFRTGAMGTRGGEPLTPQEIRVESHFDLTLSGRPDGPSFPQF